MYTVRRCIAETGLCPC